MTVSVESLVAAGTNPAVVAVPVVAVTFALLAVPNLGEVPLNRAVTALGGAVLLVALGILSPSTALGSVDTTTLLLVFGMLVHVEGLGASGFYGWAAGELVGRFDSERGLALGMLGLSAGLSAIALNDATVILLTPVLLEATAAADVDPVPPLVAVVLGANVGSLATPLGNPQNAYVLARSGLSTAEFVARLAPVAALCLVVTGLALAMQTPAESLPGIDADASVDRRQATLSVLFLGSTLFALLALPSLDPGVVAASTAVAHLLALQFVARTDVDRLLGRMDWQILALFVGLFVLTAGAHQSALAPLLGRFSAGLPLAGATFLLSNAVSNVPAVLLLSNAVSSQTGWLVLAAVSTLAGNATPIASAATLIVLERAKREGVSVSLRRFVVVGFPVAVVTSALATAVLLV